MTAAEFALGDIVDITIKGARVFDQGPEHLVIELSPINEGASPRRFYIPDVTEVAIERVAPKVRPGDLWRDRDGTLWFAVEGDDGNPYLMCSPTYSLPVIDAVREWGPLTPVHREDDTR